MLSSPGPSVRARFNIFWWCFMGFVSSPFVFLFGIMQSSFAWPIIFFAIILFVGSIFVTCYIFFDELFFGAGRNDRYQQARLIAENERLKATEAAEKAEYTEWQARVFQTPEDSAADPAK